MPDLDLLGWVCSSEPWREQGFCSGGQRTQLLRQRGAGTELRGDPVSGKVHSLKPSVQSQGSDGMAASIFVP